MLPHFALIYFLLFLSYLQPIQTWHLLHTSVFYHLCFWVMVSVADHARKIELIRYLMSGYVHGQVLDTLSEHANALASTAVATLEDGADQLSHFPFLPVPNGPALTVPKHHGWYNRLEAASVI